MDTPKPSNSLGMKARPKPTSSRPLLRFVEERQLGGQLDRVVEGGMTAPVIGRIRVVRAATADRNTIGLGEWPP